MEFINVLNFQKNVPFKFKVKNRKNSVNINLCYKYAAAISASTTVAGYGMIISWTSPALPHLTNSTLSSFPVTEMEAAWIASLLSFGIITGYILNPFLIDTIGSKRTLLLLALPQLLSCLLIYFGQNWIVLCLARIIGGIGYGGGLCSSAIYVSQIGDENNRGFFLTFVKMFFNIGVFVTMIFGAFLTYDVMNLAIFGIPLFFLLTFLFMPDTDQFTEKGEYVQEKLTDNDGDERQIDSDCTFGIGNCFRGDLKDDVKFGGVLGDANGGAKNSNNVAANLEAGAASANDCGKNSTDADTIVDGAKHPNSFAKTSGAAAKSTNSEDFTTNVDGVVKNSVDQKPISISQNSNSIYQSPNSICLNPNNVDQNQNSFAQNVCQHKNSIIQNSDVVENSVADENSKVIIKNSETISKNQNATSDAEKANIFKPPLNPFETGISLIENGNTESYYKNPQQIKPIETKNTKANLKSQKSNWHKLFFQKNNRRALIIIISASLTEILSGHMAIVSFAQQIFEYSSTFLRAEYAALILSGLKIGASFFSTLVVEKFERRQIFLITGLLASLSQFTVGVFFFLKFYMKIDVSSLTWLPLVGVSAYEVVGSIGMSSLYYVYQGELFSNEIKGQGVTCTNISYEIITFLVKLNFQLVIDAVGIYTVFWMFSVCCAIGSCATYWITPETKGKSRREIQKLLGDKSDDFT
ncbi:facilitated trehalose transporter Tret1-like [Leptopilina heterotoma]|uniref:facilitated trehalose transporter Tret1-like n=1 Tax=Leptopilina heterotoma TaxID=63436 RepID=UPI001CA87EED|nr:facilitated trehalose transporter Tret1-like [Leptopilina heterotoma]